MPASFAIKSNVYFIAHQYLIINNSQSQRALSVSVRTVLWIYFASRRNCGLLPETVVFYLYYFRSVLWDIKVLGVLGYRPVLISLCFII